MVRPPEWAASEADRADATTREALAEPASADDASAGRWFDDTPFVDGLVLAATALGDRDGRAASANLAPWLARTLAARMAELARLDREARHGAIRALAGQLHAPLEGEAPPRALAILAPDAPREIGRQWATRAPSVRRGFRTDRALKATIRRHLRRSEPQAERAERTAAAELDEPTRARLRAIATTLAPDDPERATGALALGARGALDGDERSNPWRDAGRELASLEVLPRWRR